MGPGPRSWASMTESKRPQDLTDGGPSRIWPISTATCEDAAVSKSETDRLCEECGEPVALDSPGVIKAVEVKRIDTFRGPLWLDGAGVVFHDDCFPYGSNDYRTIG
jgi:hypothetical protein